MYTDFYRLAGFPFQLTPDHRFFFGSRPHRKAIAYLTYGLSKGEGFIVVTGEVGAGKTTMIDYLMTTLVGKNIVTARIVTTQILADDLIRLVATGFGLDASATNKATLLTEIDRFLVANYDSGNRALLIIDEVQSLSSPALEELRMLSNFGMGAKPVLQICLVGQPEFRRTLASEQLEQLRQRIIASHHLFALDPEETRGYIEHRLRCVGWANDPHIDDNAFALIYEETKGIPRRINNLCDRLMLFGYLEEKHVLLADDVAEVVADLHSELIGSTIEADDITPVMSPAPTASAEGSPKLSSPTNGNGEDVDALHARLTELETLLASAVAINRPQSRADVSATSADASAKTSSRLGD